MANVITISRRRDVVALDRGGGQEADGRQQDRGGAPFGDAGVCWTMSAVGTYLFPRSPPRIRARSRGCRPHRARPRCQTRRRDRSGSRPVTDALLRRHAYRAQARHRRSIATASVDPRPDRRLLATRRNRLPECRHRMGDCAARRYRTSGTGSARSRGWIARFLQRPGVEPAPLGHRPRPAAISFTTSSTAIPPIGC